MDDARRRRRLAARAAEIVAAVGVIFAGLGLIAGIVLLDPRWQRIVASWRERIAAPTVATRSADRPSASAASPSTSDPVAAGARPQTTRPEAPERKPAALASRPGSWAPSDSTQLMASLLVSQLGPDLAWRTALSNADAHTGDSPEHAYWRGVAAAIRDSGARPRP